MYLIFTYIYTICILYIFIYIWNTVHNIFGFHTHTYPLTIYRASAYRFPVGPWSAKISQSLKLSWAIPSFDYPPWNEDSIWKRSTMNILQAQFVPGLAVDGDYTDHMFQRLAREALYKYIFSIPIESKPFHIYLHLPYKLPMHVGK